MRWSCSTFGFVSEMQKEPLSLSRMCARWCNVFVCVHACREDSVRARSVEKPCPNACWEGGGVMTESDLELLQGQPADTANWHQQRRLVTSNACHTALQGQPTLQWRHWCGIQWPAPDSYLKVRADVGIADENRRFAASETTPGSQGKGGGVKT